MAAYLPELTRRQVGERVRPDLPGQSFRSKQAGLSRQATRVSGVVGKEATGRFPSQAGNKLCVYCMGLSQRHPQ